MYPRAKADDPEELAIGNIVHRFRACEIPRAGLESPDSGPRPSPFSPWQDAQAIFLAVAEEDLSRRPQVRVRRQRVLALVVLVGRLAGEAWLRALARDRHALGVREVGTRQMASTVDIAAAQREAGNMRPSVPKRERTV